MKDNNKPRNKIRLGPIILVILIGLGFFLLFYFLLAPRVPYVDWNTFYTWSQDPSKYFGAGVSAVADYQNEHYYVHFFLTNPADASVPNNFIVTVPQSQEAFVFGDGTTAHPGILTTICDKGFRVAITNNSGWINILFSLLPIALLIGFGVWFFRSMSKGRGGFDFSFSKNKARLHTSKTKFIDVAGYVEEKMELKEVVDFLKTPQRFKTMGARTPKGVLMMGPPGTGKTLLAKAVAGEAHVAFYSISGSDFVEMFVGVGASRVRDMFSTAKKSAPCIIFIDEVDAVGRQRGAGLGGGNDEREQTLNQLLVEMDGLETAAGIVIMAASNRPDVLDPALLRPGRFDRQILVHLPDKEERAAILKIHARNKNVSQDVDFNEVANRTPGFSGAQLENVLNEAAIWAVRNNRTTISREDIDEGIDRVVGGPAKTTRKYIENEKRTVAYHEAGHAVVGLILKDADLVQKVTIIPRGMAGGYTIMTPRDEKFLASKKELLQKITGYLAGRASEELIFGKENITSGASNDIEIATKIAKALVTKYGMSEAIGEIDYSADNSAPFLGRDLMSRPNASEQISYLIEQEIRRIITTAKKDATAILKKNRLVLDLIAKALIQHETIIAPQIKFIYDNKKLPPDLDDLNADSKNNKDNKPIEYLTDQGTKLNPTK